MIAIVGLFLKGFLSTGLGIVKSIFSDWRILCAIIFLLIAGVTYYKYNELQKDISLKQATIENQIEINKVIGNNNKVLLDANAQNYEVLLQVKRDQEQALATVNKLNTDIATSSKKITELKKQLDYINTPPTPLSPYLIEAINGIQGNKE